MNREITLVFTPFFLKNNSFEENYIDSYKNKSFSLWLDYASSADNESFIHEILPSNTNPISLGQLCLVTYLSKHNIKVNYVHGDYYIRKKGFDEDTFVKYLVDVSKNSVAIGFYSMTPTINVALDLMKSVKQLNPAIYTILGGPHGTYVDVETLENNPFVDVISRGEGEETLLELVLALSKDLSELDNIKGITYNLNGVIKRNLDRELLCQTDIPSPDYSVLPPDFNCLLTVMYARGCPYSCKFCAEGAIWRHKLRFRKPYMVAQEIKYIYDNWKQRVIHICDSEIDAVPQKLNELLDCILKLKLNCHFTVNLRCDAYKRLDTDMVYKMKKAGVVAYLIGVESASDDMLSRMGRNSTFSDFLKTIDLLNQCDAGMIFPGLMLGFPGETVSTIEETKEKFLALLEDDKVDYFFPKVFVPYPGTEPYEKQSQYNISFENKWDQFARFVLHQPFVSPVLSREQLEFHMIDFYKKIVEVYEKKCENKRNG